MPSTESPEEETAEAAGAPEGRSTSRGKQLQTGIWCSRSGWSWCWLWRRAVALRESALTVVDAAKSERGGEGRRGGAWDGAGADSMDDLDCGMGRLRTEIRTPSTLGTFLRAFTLGPSGSSTRSRPCRLVWERPSVRGMNRPVRAEVHRQPLEVGGRDAHAGNQQERPALGSVETADPDIYQTAPGSADGDGRFWPGGAGTASSFRPPSILVVTAQARGRRSR
jgi:hypothetical protein